MKTVPNGCTTVFPLTLAGRKQLPVVSVNSSAFFKNYRKHFNVQYIQEPKCMTAAEMLSIGSCNISLFSSSCCLTLTFKTLYLVHTGVFFILIVLIQPESYADWTWSLQSYPRYHTIHAVTTRFIQLILCTVLVTLQSVIVITVNHLICRKAGLMCMLFWLKPLDTSLSVLWTVLVYEADQRQRDASDALTVQGKNWVA